MNTPFRALMIECMEDRIVQTEKRVEVEKKEKKVEKEKQINKEEEVKRLFELADVDRDGFWNMNEANIVRSVL